jgi:hypothetical protein
MLAGRVFGIGFPDAGPVFVVTLVMHVVAGLTCVVAGVLAATAAKRPGRHPRAGRTYLVGITVVFGTASVLAALRWSHDRHLFVLGAVAFAAAAAGYVARRRRRPGWVRRHLVGMGVSYITLLTAFYVDNGPQLPLWDRLPTLALWLLPGAVGLPIVGRALWLRPGGQVNAVRPGSRHRSPHSGAPPARRG